MVIANYPEFVTLKFAISRLGASPYLHFLYKQTNWRTCADSGSASGDDDGVDGLDYRRCWTA